MPIAFLFRLFARLPLSLLHRIGGCAGWLVYWLDKGYRRRLRENLALALGRDDAAIRRAAIAGAGRQMLELPWLWLRPAEEIVASVVRAEGWELVEQAWRDGVGILFLTPHLGCFEITSQYYGASAPVTVLYRPPRKTALGPLMERGRTRGAVSIAPADLSGVRRLLKTLRGREAVGILPDQVPAAGEGVWAPFFGRPAWTMTLAARLAEVKNVRLLYIWAERLPGGAGYAMHVSAPAETLEGDAGQRCAAINRDIERLILRCPAQYLWGYHRYKKPKTGDAAAHAPDASSGHEADI